MGKWMYTWGVPLLLVVGKWMDTWGVPLLLVACGIACLLVWTWAIIAALGYG